MKKYADLTEQLFENKNKAYGAYQLRKRSGRFTLSGFLLATLLVSGGFTAPWLWHHIDLKRQSTAQKPVLQKKVVSYSELSAPPPIELDQPPPRQVVLKKKPTLKFLTPVAKPDEEVPDELEEIPTMEEMARVDPGASTVEGDSLAYETQDVEEVFLDEGPTEPEKVYQFVERMPRFPGGEKALLRFINQNLVYPKIALEHQIEGMVAVQFIIGSDGVVRDIMIMRGLNEACDEEVVRVVSLLPDWEPGYQSNRPVPVKFVLPVKFKIQ